MHAFGFGTVYLFVGQLEAMAPKLATALLLAANAFAGEYAVLASGFSMHIERHEANGSNLRVFINGGFMDFPAASVVRFEQEYTASPWRACRGAEPESPSGETACGRCRPALEPSGGVS